MCDADDPAVRDAATWLDTARRLAADGALADAIAAYESAVRGLDRHPAGCGWRITVLGGFTVTVDGRPVDLSPLRPQHRMLLQVFSAYAGRSVGDRRLCAWFWPDTDPGTARHRLTVGVSAIRSLLSAAGGPQLVRGIDGYRLRTDGGDTDAGHFQRLLGVAQGAGRDERVPRWENALAAYGGPLLPAAGDADWVVVERDRLQTSALRVAAELADAHARAGRPRDVVRVARSGLGHDRSHDRLWRRLVAALTELGEPAAAATARREYGEVLADLGVFAGPVGERRLHSA